MLKYLGIRIDGWTFSGVQKDVSVTHDMVPGKKTFKALDVNRYYYIGYIINEYQYSMALQQ